MPPLRVVAVDWSGSADPRVQRKTIVAATTVDGVLTSVEAGRSRTEVVAWLLAERPDVIGIDCSFSLPAWWLDAHDLADGPALWEAAATDGERWLAECEPPFWGRQPVLRRPPDHEPWRACERLLRTLGHRPSSTFQIGGAGSVGTGSVRAWPHLAELRAAGFAVWPFDGARTPGERPTVVEVWPRLAAPALRKEDAEDRRSLAAGMPCTDEEVRSAAAASADAIDAAAAAVQLSSMLLAGFPLSVPAPSGPAALREGWVAGL